MRNDEAEFRKSSFCSGGNCVEVGLVNDDVLVRSSTTDNATQIRFSRAEWAAFVQGVRAGEFDFSTG